MRRIILGTLLLLSACTSKIVGDLQVDGAPFQIKECRSGQALGFSGILLVENGGRQLRLLASGDGNTVAALFAPGAERGDTLGTCGTLGMHAQNSRINSIVNVEGTAALACEAVGHKISGKVTFENCH